MTNTIDHRILIPAGPEIIWETISDISKNPRWQVDCQEVAFLTSLRQGQGTRWRYSNERGREFVAEITAWYNTLGYEYCLVDGAPFKYNQGRIRLQEIAEGTIVQWTFNYELRGMLSGIRTIGTPRNVENGMVDSLWTLWKLITEKDDAEEHEARSLMRDAPDVEQRANYVARHQGGYRPSVAMPEKQEPAVSMPSFTIQEPPIADDDTRPRPSIAAASIAQTEKLTNADEIESNVTEPDFLSEISTDDLDADTSPGISASTSEPVDQPTASTEPVETAPVGSEEDALKEPADSAHPIETVVPSDTQADSLLEPELEPAAKANEASVPIHASEVNEQSEAITSEERRSVDNTANVSVFDLFGVPKPSETQETQAVSAPTAPDEPAKPTTLETEAEKPATEPDGKQTETQDTGSVEANYTATIHDHTPISNKTVTQETIITSPGEGEAGEQQVTNEKRIGLRLRLRHQLIELRCP
jgi:hypothetical protein